MLLEPFNALSVQKLQFTCDSRWEECLVLERGGEEADIERWLRDFNAEAVGAEAFFTCAGHSLAAPSFTGLRLRGSNENLKAVRMAAQKFISGELLCVSDFVLWAENAAGAPLFIGEPAFLELGLVNLWNSFGPLRFKVSPDEDYSEALARILAEAPRFNGPLPAPPAVEFGFEVPLPHWLGVSAAIGGDGAYRVAGLPSAISRRRP